MMRVDAAWLVLAGGVSAALHVGKLPPAVPVLREALGISWVEAGFLLSLVQLAGMTLGLLVGAAADRWGARRTMVLGLAILSIASAMGATARGPQALLVLRACEGLGFLLASLPAPGLLRQLVPTARLSRVLGLWGAYMPLGTALALLAGPAALAAVGWPGWWLGLALVSASMAVAVAVAVPARVDVAAAAAPERGGALMRTLCSRGPWLAALAFCAYSGQWLAVIGFLPAIYAQAGVSPSIAALATASAAAVNMLGNIAAGGLLHRGVPPALLLQTGFAAMAAGAFVAFGPGSEAAGPAIRFGGIVLFSAVGGLVPGTLFSAAVRLAPDERSVSTTIGWMQQWSALGQFGGPPAVAWLASRTGRWDATWWVSACCAGFGMMVAAVIGRQLGRAGRDEAQAAPRIGP